MEFAKYAADIAPSLQDLGPQSGPHAVFIYRLMFAVRYSQFQRSRASLELQDAASDLVAMLHEDVAPKSWCAVLLCDAIDLLQFGTWYRGSGPFDDNRLSSIRFYAIIHHVGRWCSVAKTGRDLHQDISRRGGRLLECSGEDNQRCWRERGPRTLENCPFSTSTVLR